MIIFLNFLKIFPLLLQIEELRQKDLNIDLSTQPVFMDVDMDFSAVESDPKCLIYAVLDTNILLSHLSFTAELLDCNLSGQSRDFILFLKFFFNVCNLFCYVSY